MNLRRVIKVTERSWYFLRIPVFFVLVITIIHTFFITIFIVDGRSMYPTLKDHQILLVNKISTLMMAPKKGDIVIMQFPGDTKRRIFVKRVIGAPGDIFQANREDEHGLITSKDIQISNGEYYVLGDNRPESGDSRIWGSVPREYIIGSVFY